MPFVPNSDPNLIKAKLTQVDQMIAETEVGNQEGSLIKGDRKARRRAKKLGRRK